MRLFQLNYTVKVICIHNNVTLLSIVASLGLIGIAAPVLYFSKKVSVCRATDGGVETGLKEGLNWTLSRYSSRTVT